MIKTNATLDNLSIGDSSKNGDAGNGQPTFVYGKHQDLKHDRKNRRVETEWHYRGPGQGVILCVISDNRRIAEFEITAEQIAAVQSLL